MSFSLIQIDKMIPNVGESVGIESPSITAFGNVVIYMFIFLS